MINLSNKSITREVEVTSNSDLIDTKEFEIILKIINELSQAGVIFNFANNCVSAADILQSMLAKEGIETEIVEVQAIIIKHRPVKSTMFVGFDHQVSNIGNEVDTHVIVVTKTELPILIDISLSHLLPDSHPWIVEPLAFTVDERDIAEYRFENFEISYKRKKFNKVPIFYKKTLSEKINSEVQLRNSIKFVLKLAFIAVALSTFNFFANITLLLEKFVF